jgi:hypothetical protein
MKKAVTLIIIILITISVYYYTLTLKPKKTEQESQAVNIQKQVGLSNAILNKGAEDISDDTENVGQFTGYYAKKIGTIHDNENDPSSPLIDECDTFVVLSGDTPLVNYFRNLVITGNSINSINEKGNLAVNISIIPNTPREKQLLASNENKPITITLQKIKQEGRGGTPCMSYFKSI